jgi:hypothetical protein
MVLSRLVSRNKVIHRRGGGGAGEVFRDQHKRKRYLLYMTFLVVTTSLIIVILSSIYDSSIRTHVSSSDIVTLWQEYTVNHANGEQQSSTVFNQHQPQNMRGKQEAAHVQVESRIQAEIEPVTSLENVDRPGGNKVDVDDDVDADCPFRNSPLYRKIFVYPDHGDVENGWSGSILSNNSNSTPPPPWPWLEFDRQARQDGTSHYDITSTHVQYTTELLVRQVMVHPKSCLRTYNPEEASLFYVPYLPSVEHHQGSVRVNDYTTSPYGQAISDILEKGQYDAWEYWFGLTSQYWKRRNGADHVLVFSEPLHGLFHPKLKRGNFHYIHTQKQLSPPIIISVELSTTFVQQYPHCARKNILLPYPNTDGRWFNGHYEKMAAQLRRSLHQQDNNTLTASVVDTASESYMVQERPVSQYFSVGLHGTCTKLRRAMTSDYSCSLSSRFLQELQVQQEQLVVGRDGNDEQRHAAVGMLLSTFCPCPGGDSPSAKRMFDAIFMGCIPVIISADFVWPLSQEFDPTAVNNSLNPDDFALRFLASDHNTRALDPESCQARNATRSLGLQTRLDSISVQEIERLRQGLQKARDLYSWYQPSEYLVDNPLRQGILPDGGAAHALLRALAERANVVKWPACEQELKLLSPEREEAKRFNC